LSRLTSEVHTATCPYCSFSHNSSMSLYSSDPASLRDEVEVLPLPPAYSRHSKVAFEVQDPEEEDSDASIPLGRICLTASLLFIGAGLLFFGVLAEIRSPVPGKGVAYLVMGVLFLIPGAYCTVELVRMWNIQPDMTRIPEEVQI